MSSCSITFHNNPQAVFYGGQVLSGTAVLTTVKQKTIRAIHIEINGRAKVRWEESRTRTNSEGKSETYTEYYSGDEQYLASRTYVAGASGANSFEFMPGRYSYDFQVQLPLQLPSSIEGRYGNIRYEVRLTMDRPWRFDNVFKRMFTVIETLNLNYDPIYKQPIMAEDVKTFCCGCCCGDEHIRIICRIPFSGYASGQRIPYFVRVENNSTVECYNSDISLEKTIRFTARSPEHKSRYETNLITEKQLGQVLKSSNKEFKDFLLVPPIPPSSANSHHIIEAYYVVKVELNTSGCHRNATLTFPIKIGTVPLMESATNPASVITMQPTAPQKLLQEGDSPPPYLPNAPPCYEDAMKGETLADDDDKHIITEPYVPKYPVYYNFAAPTAPQMEPAGPSTSTNLNGAASTSAALDIDQLISNPNGNNSEKAQYGWKA